MNVELYCSNRMAHVVSVELFPIVFFLKFNSFSPGISMATGERWLDTVRMSASALGEAAAANDISEGIGTTAARKVIVVVP
jgi:hypothetical protein